MRKLICGILSGAAALLLVGCGYQAGSGEAIIKEINNDVVTVEYNGKEYTWKDSKEVLTYGDCTVYYKYKMDKDAVDSETIKIKKVTQAEAQQYETGSNEATIEEIDGDIVTVEYSGKSYTWKDSEKILTYGECTIEYKYKNDRTHRDEVNLETLEVQKITQTEPQKHDRGELRSINFEYNHYSTPTAPCEILADDFRAVVNYWGDSTTHYYDVKLLDDNGKEVDGWRIKSSGTYDFDMQWDNIKETVSLYVGKKTADWHKCEECSNEGTNKFESFTGQTEYYCDKHYKELMEMFGYLLTH